MYGGTALADQRSDGNIVQNGDLIDYGLVFAGMGAGMALAGFLLIGRWDDPVNFAIALVLCGCIAIVSRLIG